VEPARAARLALAIPEIGMSGLHAGAMPLNPSLALSEERDNRDRLSGVVCPRSVYTAGGFSVSFGGQLFGLIDARNWSDQAHLGFV